MTTRDNFTLDSDDYPHVLAEVFDCACHWLYDEDEPGDAEQAARFLRARELAELAPELLVACQSLVKAIADWRRVRCGTLEYWAGPAIEQARTIISKVNAS